MFNNVLMFNSTSFDDVHYTVAVATTLPAGLSSLSSPLASPTTMLPFTTQPAIMPPNCELTGRDMCCLCIVIAGVETVQD